LNAYTSREQTAFTARAFDHDLPKMVEIIADITQNSKLDASAVDREKDVILRETEEVNKDIVELIFDQLHAVAFEGRSLS